MRELESIYRGGFFKNRHRLAWRTSIICNAINQHIKLDSVIDVGCAIGDLVSGFSAQGKTAMGLEGSTAVQPFLIVPEEQVLFWDLRERMEPGIVFDLACCFEVAEHIEPEFANIFVANLAGLSNQILISIAPPGQDGHYHVNCRPIDYWDDWFALQGFDRDDDIAEKIKWEWEPYRHKPGIKAFYQNLHFYAKTGETI